MHDHVDCTVTVIGGNDMNGNEFTLCKPANDAGIDKLDLAAA